MRHTRAEAVVLTAVHVSSAIHCHPTKAFRCTMDFELEGYRKRQGSSISMNEDSAPCTSSSQPDHLSNNHVPSNGFFNNSRQIHVSGGTYNYIHQGNNPSRLTSLVEGLGAHHKFDLQILAFSSS